MDLLVKVFLKVGIFLFLKENIALESNFIHLWGKPEWENSILSGKPVYMFFVLNEFIFIKARRSIPLSFEKSYNLYLKYFPGSDFK